MIAYRVALFGVERVEDGSSTFIHADPRHPAWREYEAWRRLGKEVTAGPERGYAAEAPKRKQLWIVGAGGYGREVYWMTKSAWGCDWDWEVAGFLNDIKDALDDFPDLPRIHADTDYEPGADDVFVCAIGEPAGRRKVCAKLKSRGAQFLNLIQKTACIAPSATLGEGVIVEPYTSIGANCRVGNFTTILTHVAVAHDAIIGEAAQISPFACILGRASIGEEAKIGSHAVVLPDVTIGDGATVGAGSVVIRNVEAGATVFGVPAMKVQ